MRIVSDFVIYGIAAILFLATAANASSVTVPNTFSQGSVISSSQMNDNFSAVKTAVDDSQAQIDAQKTQIAGLETAKQNKVTGTCAPGSFIAAVKPDGTVTCSAFTAAAPLAVAGSTLSLQGLGITNAHISPAAAIAASKIFGDAGIEFSPRISRVDLPNNSATPTVVTSMTMSAPSAGTILVIVNGGVHPSDTHMLASLGIGLSPTTYAAVNSQWAAGSSTTILPFTVAAAGDYAFFALANETDPTNAGTSWVTDVQLVGLFIPKRY
jgi:hypothetical protein